MRSVVVLIACVLIGGFATASEPDPAALLQAIRSMKLETSRAVTVSSMKLDLGPASLELVSGVLVPATPIAGTTPEWSFAGEAWFVLATDDPVERHQIELFTGAPVLRERVTAAVLVVTSDAVSRTLFNRAGADTPNPVVV